MLWKEITIDEADFKAQETLLRHYRDLVSSLEKRRLFVRVSEHCEFLPKTDHREIIRLPFGFSLIREVR